MKKSTRIGAFVFSLLFVFTVFGFGISALVRTPDEISKSERRELTKRPDVTIETIRNGKFFTDEEKYLLDQFPMRDGFRRIKSAAHFYIFRQKVNNKIVISGGHAAEISYPMKETAADTYIKRLNKIYEKYLADKNMNIYSTIIPDKMYFIADKIGAPSIDYAALSDKIKSGVTSAKFINIFDTLDIDCYYKTDTHWKEDKIIPAANRLLEVMGRAKCKEASIEKSLAPFYGVYYGQSALPLSPDTISCVMTPTLKKAKVYRADKKTGELTEAKLYYDEYITANDAYDVFMGGACTVTVIENPENPDGKTLYLFSDSFGRSLAPLLLSDYSKVVFYDIRYIRAEKAFSIVPLEEGGDVLFAYNISAIDVSSNLQVN